MTIDSHMKGFEKENTFRELFGDIHEYYPDLKWQQLISAIEKIAPLYSEALGARRPCIRKLRYIGRTWCPETPPTSDDFFKLGQVCESATFNGATYTIEEYGERPIGFAYFEWLMEDSTNLEKNEP